MLLACINSLSSIFREALVNQALKVLRVIPYEKFLHDGCYLSASKRQGHRENHKQIIPICVKRYTIYIPFELQIIPLVVFGV